MEIYLILFLISLGVNIHFILILLLRKSRVELKFEDSLYILDSVISNERVIFFRGLNSLSKQYSILKSKGELSPPDDRVLEYKKKKEELKEKITKRIIRHLSKNLRRTLLYYYSERGLASHIISELDKDSAPMIEGGSN